MKTYTITLTEDELTELIGCAQITSSIRNAQLEGRAGDWNKPPFNTERLQEQRNAAIKLEHLLIGNLTK